MTGGCVVTVGSTALWNITRIDTVNLMFCNVRLCCNSVGCSAVMASCSKSRCGELMLVTYVVVALRNAVADWIG